MYNTSVMYQAKRGTAELNRSAMSNNNGHYPSSSMTRNNQNVRNTFVSKEQQRDNLRSQAQANSSFGSANITLQAGDKPPANSLGLMKLPGIKPKQVFSVQKETPRAEAIESNVSIRTSKVGISEREKMCILTGNVERVIKFGKIFQSQFCLFQVFGNVLSISDGKVHFQKIMLLRDKKGPVLQVVYYSNSTYIKFDDFYLGQTLRVVGRITGANVMSAISMRAATTDEVENLPRLCCVSDYAVSSLCDDNQHLTGQ